MDLLKSTNMMLFPPELLTHIVYFIPNETFILSKVCKLWVTILDKIILTDKMENKKLLRSDAYKIIKDLGNNSYALAKYIKRFRIIRHLSTRTVNSLNCLDILTWNLCNSKLNEPKKCSSCGSVSCARGERIYMKLLRQYCVVDGTIMCADKLLTTMASYIKLNKSTFNELESICLKNKSSNMERWIKEKRAYYKQ